MSVPPAIARVAAASILAIVAAGAAVLAFDDQSEAPRAEVPSIYRMPRAAVAAPKAAPAPKPTTAAVPTQTASAYRVKSILPIEGPLRYGDWHWDDGTAPPGGAIVVTVDLAARVLSVFRDGHEIGATAVIYGADEKPTPLGVFPVTQKDAHHVSNIYGAPMPYMLRMTNDGVSIHGSEVSAELMTHGCVGVPTAFARKLFGVVKLGDKVIVTRGERLDLGEAITAA